jgi:rod shape determining protein RodA
LSRFGNGLKMLRRMNWPMAGAAALLLVSGIFFVYSACYFSEDPEIRDLYKRQIVWSVIGAACYLGFALTDYRSLRKLAWLGYAGTVALLVMVLLVGTRVYGARRWLDLFFFQIQPSELAKLATILVLARLLSWPGENLGHFRPLAKALGVAALPMLLVFKEPDLGTALVFVPVALVMMFVAGVPWRPLAALGLAGAVAIGLFLGGLFLPARLGADEETQQRVMKMMGVSQYQKDRLETFFRSESDPLGSGWNKRQSEIAVGSGALWGKGYLEGTQNILGFLPRTVARTDFIFSVIAEEKGFAGSLAVLALYGMIAAAGIGTALAAHDKMGRLLCVGVVTLVFSHVVVNIAMTVGLMPITGLPLPLLSYGGTFMVVSLSALGMVQSVHIRAHHVPEEFEQGALWARG